MMEKKYVMIILGVLLVLLCAYFVKWKHYISKVRFAQLEKHQTENGCYKEAKPIKEVQGIAVFCTETNEPYLKTYIDLADKVIANGESTHWNNIHNSKIPHEFIGLDENSGVVIVNTLPHKYACSFNECNCGIDPDTLSNNYIKIYVCRDSLQQNSEYFNNTVRNALVELCGVLCNKYKIKPNRIICDPLCDEWFNKNEYSEKELKSDVESRNHPLMMIYNGYQRIRQWIKKHFCKHKAIKEYSVEDLKKLRKQYKVLNYILVILSPVWIVFVRIRYYFTLNIPIHLFIPLILIIIIADIMEKIKKRINEIELNEHVESDSKFTEKLNKIWIFSHRVALIILMVYWVIKKFN